MGIEVDQIIQIHLSQSIRRLRFFYGVRAKNSD